MKEFRTRHFPGEASRATVFAWSFARAMAAVFFVLLVLGVLYALLNAPILGATLALFPIATALAAGWSLLSLQRTPSRCVVAGPVGCMRSVWDDAGRLPLALVAVEQPRRVEGVLHVGLAGQVYVLHPADWPAFEDLWKALQQAASETLAGGRPLP